jgi:hypothetical protein
VAGGEPLQRLEDATRPLLVEDLGDRHLVALAAAQEREALRQDDELGAAPRGLAGKCRDCREILLQVVARAHLHRADRQAIALLHDLDGYHSRRGGRARRHGW